MMKLEVRVLFFPVGEEPQLRYIHTDLESMQAAIGGGYVECLGLTEDLDAWFDEEGRVKPLPFNCLLQRPGEEGFHEIFGPMFIAANDGDGELSSVLDRHSPSIACGRMQDGRRVVKVG